MGHSEVLLAVKVSDGQCTISQHERSRGRLPVRLVEAEEKVCVDIGRACCRVLLSRLVNSALVRDIDGLN
jgi:hypothetical protein